MFRVTWQLNMKKCHPKKNIYGRAALSFSDEMLRKQFGACVFLLKESNVVFLSLDHLGFLYP